MITEGPEVSTQKASFKESHKICSAGWETSLKWCNARSIYNSRSVLLCEFSFAMPDQICGSRSNLQHYISFAMVDKIYKHFIDQFCSEDQIYIIQLDLAHHPACLVSLLSDNSDLAWHSHISEIVAEG